MHHPPSGPIKTINGCIECCNGNHKNSSSEKCQGGGNCQCACKCFGWFQHKDWDFSNEDMQELKEVLDQEGASIKILYRDKIKVFYSRVKDAEFDGYTDFK